MRSITVDSEITRCTCLWTCTNIEHQINLLIPDFVPEIEAAAVFLAKVFKNCTGTVFA